MPAIEEFEELKQVDSSSSPNIIKEEDDDDDSAAAIKRTNEMLIGKQTSALI